VASLDTPLANTSKEFHPALITLVKLLARQAAREALARQLSSRDTDHNS
jgi:hypothetical protein